LMDYGAPIGYRIAIKHLDRVSAMIIQNGNAYAEGLKDWAKVVASMRDGFCAGAPLTTRSDSASSPRST
jgi:hypothetical protein